MRYQNNCRKFFCETFVHKVLEASLLFITFKRQHNTKFLLSNHAASFLLNSLFTSTYSNFFACRSVSFVATQQTCLLHIFFVTAYQETICCHIYTSIIYVKLCNHCTLKRQARSFHFRQILTVASDNHLKVVASPSRLIIYEAKNKVGMTPGFPYSGSLSTFLHNRVNEQRISEICQKQMRPANIYNIETLELNLLESNKLAKT